MQIQFLSNLPPIGESIAKVASKGGQLIVDNISLYGFFAFCLLFVGCCLMIPTHMYEKYYKVQDDAPAAPETTVREEAKGAANPAA
jgi:hypothetical protein